MECPVHVLDITDKIPIPDTINFLPVDLHDEKTMLSTFVEDGELVSNYLVLAIPKNYAKMDIKLPIEDVTEIAENIHQIGLLCKIDEFEYNEDTSFGLFSLRVQARCYINTELFISGDYELWANIILIDETITKEEEDIVQDIDRITEIILQNTGLFSAVLSDELAQTKNSIQKMNVLAEECIEDDAERIIYLQTESQFDRWLILTGALSKKLKKNNEIKHRPAKAQQEPTEKQDPLLEKLNAMDAPEHIKVKLTEEIERLKTIPKNSLEYSLSRDYLKYVLGLPWTEPEKTTIDLKKLQNKLNETHYGLEDVKEYLLEHICIEQIRDAPSGAIMCLVGPPSTGKSSIAKALAEASGRKFHRISMGGVSDETALRGSRRTYVASRAGRIINALKETKTKKTLILLDEIDKIESSRNPATSALLEILDPDQNSEFVDRYLEIPFDLSQVLFVCTANYKKQIPPALMSRLEVINMRDYTQEERLIILRDYIHPRAMKEYKLNSETFKITFTDEVFELLSETLQLRQIEKTIKRLLRKAALMIYMDGVPEVLIDKAFVTNAKKHQVANKSPQKTLGF